MSKEIIACETCYYQFNTLLKQQIGCWNRDPDRYLRNALFFLILYNWSTWKGQVRNSISPRNIDQPHIDSLLILNNHSSSNTQALRWLTSRTQPLSAVFALHHAAAAVLPSVPGWGCLALATAPMSALCPTGGPLCPLCPAAIHWNAKAEACHFTAERITPGLRGIGTWRYNAAWCMCQMVN